MQIQENVSLKDFSTMKLGGTTRYFTTLTDIDQIPDVVSLAGNRNLPIKVIGGGSNVIWKETGFDGILIANALRGFTVLSESDDTTTISIATGEDWDQIVAKTVEMNLYGIECLSLIPGTVGGTPVQNVGAYGQDISQTLQSLTAYDVRSNEFVQIQAADCGLDYRTSRFKTDDKDRFIITEITLVLSKSPKQSTHYPAVAAYLSEHGIASPKPADLRAAVIAIRSAKLPDPKVVANNGSFFANPIVSAEHYERLRTSFPTVAAWHLPNGTYKISAAWLIETAGFKGVEDAETGMATWPKQPLVLVNQHAKTTEDLITFRDRIIKSVYDLSQITLIQEPELLP